MPMETKITHSSLFEVLPSSRCKPEQVAHWSGSVKSPTYTLLRELNSLDELNEYDHLMAIWLDNETLTYVKARGNRAFPFLVDDRRSMSLEFSDKGPLIEIFGKTDEAIAETVSYFLSLEKPMAETVSSRLFVRGGDFRAVGTHCLPHIFDVAPFRELEFCFTILSAEQCTVLATRPDPIRLSFSCCEFDDGGTAFVEALENRVSPFGSLTVRSALSLTNANLKRLIQVDTIDHLDLSLLAFNEIAHLAFSARVNSFHYDIYTSSLLEADLQSMNIVATKLSLCIHHEGGNFPIETVLAFFQRLANLGRFKELKVAFCFNVEDIDASVPGRIVQGLICVALANSSLSVLHFIESDLRWELHLESLFNGLKDHKGLRTLNVSVHNKDEAFGPNFANLRRFLSHNRNVVVTDEDGTIFSDGSSIDALYSLNRFFLGSAGLLVEPSSERPSLVAAALMESASKDFQRSALLLSNHLDVLCEVVQLAQLDEL